MHHRAGVGHIGGNLGCIDILAAAFGHAMASDDQFVLSKGHAAGALYVTLWAQGVLSDADLATFHKDGTLLAGHPPASGIGQIPFATGSLGHGIGLASGLALGWRMVGNDRHAFCLTSDGEWNEGSCWEALAFAVHHRLANLTIIVDVNGLQGFGTTREVMDMDPLAARFRAFGADVTEVDGHDLDALSVVLAVPGRHGRATSDTRRPRVVVAHTIKGKGVSFMEGRMEWHYLPLTDDLLAQALADLEAADGATT
jgi:transketolase